MVGDLPVVFSLTKYSGSAWWINIILLLPWVGSTLGTPTDICTDTYRYIVNKQMNGGLRKGDIFLCGSSVRGLHSGDPKG